MTSFSFPSSSQETSEQMRASLLTRRFEWIFNQTNFFKGEILEYGALLSLSLKDVASFERYAIQLKNYYYDFGYTFFIN
jgi:hypothetical protein